MKEENCGERVNRKISKKIEIKNWVIRIIIYIVGIFILALGVSFSIVSNLGVSPVNSIPYVVSEILQVDMGICATLVMVIFILIQMLLMGKEFKWLSWIQVISSVIFGYCVSFTNQLTRNLEIRDNYYIQLFFCGLGVICVAIGVYTYLEMNILSLPGEGVMQALCHRFHIELPTAKTAFDCTLVAIACIISFVTFGTVIGAREGTILAALGVGTCIRGIKFVRNNIFKSQYKKI